MHRNYSCLEFAPLISFMFNTMCSLSLKACAQKPLVFPGYLFLGSVRHIEQSLWSNLCAYLSQLGHKEDLVMGIFNMGSKLYHEVPFILCLAYEKAFVCFPI